MDTGPLPGRTELLAAGETLLAVHRRNDFDEESVEIWRVYVSGALGAPGAQVAPGAR
ncbi:MAG TPA: hypothetical protein VFQ22_08180 [Longimicrobiales bacterium]|nr:hypothetical protein [Longimicrobiales bacterium]